MPLQQRPPAGGQLERLAALEGVVVGDDDARLLQVAAHVAGDQFSARIVAVGVVPLEDPQPLSDRHAGGNDEKPAREARTAGAPHRVHRLPCNEQRHHGHLAGPGRQLQREAIELNRVLGSSLGCWRRLKCSRCSRPSLPSFGATSVSQIMVSTAST